MSAGIHFNVHGINIVVPESADVSKEHVAAVLGVNPALLAAADPIDTSEHVTINSALDLAQVAKIVRDRINETHMRGGVIIFDPDNTYIGAHVTIGAGTVILPNCMIYGNSTIGEDCTIGPGSRLTDVTIDNRVTIENSVAKKAAIGDDTIVGPFANLREGAILGRNVRIGDFVEVKNTSFGDGSKASHLSYIGDSFVGSGVNLGCGVVTVNYDGFEKHRTTILDGAFVGCNTKLIAPVTVGQGAYTAAGSTITKDVPADSLGVARSRQTNLSGWAEQRRNNK